MTHPGSFTVLSMQPTLPHEPLYFSTNPPSSSCVCHSTTCAGDRLVVARGGRGGTGVVAPSRQQKQSELQRQYKYARESGTEVVAVEDDNWKVDTQGAAGQQLSLHLLLRVVADVGIVGFPNAGGCCQWA